MCTGAEAALLAASAISTAGGAYMQNQAANDRAKAQREAAMSELLRQQEFDKEKQANFEEALRLADRETQDQNLDDATAERQAAIEANVGLPGENESYQSPTASDAPKVVKQYAEQQSNEADDFVSQLGKARARLGAWGEGMRPFAEGLSDLDWWNSEINRQASDSARTGQLEASLAAQGVGDGKALAGNLLSSAGQMGMGYAGSQGAYSNLGSLFRGSGSINNGNLYSQVATGAKYAGGTPGRLY